MQPQKTLDECPLSVELVAVTSVSKEWAIFGLPQGKRLIGYGPFTRSATRPAEVVAFYLNDFGLTQEMPWRIPARWEIVDAADVPTTELPRISWSVPDAGSFAQVFQDISQAIRKGIFEKTVPVSVEHGTCT